MVTDVVLLDLISLRDADDCVAARREVGRLDVRRLNSQFSA